MEATSDARERVWEQWKAYCKDYGVRPYLDGEDFETIARISTGFGAKVRCGKRGAPVSAGMVRAGLGGVNTTIALDTGRQPLHQTDGKHYIKPIQLMLAGFKNFDPGVQKKLAVHPDLPQAAVEWGTRKRCSEKERAVADLVNIAFYFLLRVGEYTTKTRRKGKRRKKKRTRQFRVKDVSFFKKLKCGGMKLLPKDASEEEIMAADGVTLWISNQKNGHKGQSISQQKMRGKRPCVVRSLARRYIHIKKHSASGNAMICSYWDEMGKADVTDRDISFAVKFASAMLDYPERGIPVERVDTHSLRAGGACALKLAGYRDSTIIKQGRWSPESTTFLEYIQNQLSTFTDGMARRMSQIKTFTNMEGASRREDLRHLMNV